ncbi:MAG: glycosyltransferase family 2 protein [Patescibacteria group bacterium]|nr:glycosyltransferase family 2 protein [Patescibacteria group bacterium]
MNHSMDKPFLSVIIPAYNEEKRLPATLVEAHEYLSNAGFSYEIIVVNDGSHDGTAEVVQKMAEKIDGLTLIGNDVNKGKGGVVRQGMLAARGKVRLFADADNSTSISQFRKMVPFFQEGGNGGCEVVIGSRAIQGAELVPPQPFYRRVAGKILNGITQILLVPGIWDTQCGFKAFTDTAAQDIFSRASINGWAFDVEVLALARALGYTIKEVPVRWSNNVFSRVPASAGLQFIIENVIIRFRLWRGIYRI